MQYLNPAKLSNRGSTDRGVFVVDLWFIYIVIRFHKWELRGSAVKAAIATSPFLFNFNHFLYLLWNDHEHLFCHQAASAQALIHPRVFFFGFFSPAGISGKSQVLFAIVFTTRYLDLFTIFISPYNTIMKVRRSATHGFTNLQHVDWKRLLNAR